MSKKNGRLGGFTAQNSGKIDNCYSVVRMDAKGCTSGGFAGENTGTISKSYSRCKLNGLTGGFSKEEGGDPEQSCCYFFHEEKEGSKKLEKLSDPIRGQRLKELETAEDIENLGFDLEEIWERHDGKAPLNFIADNWMFNIEQSASFSRYLPVADTSSAPDSSGETAIPPQLDVQVTVISTADELWELAKQINAGNRELAAAYIRLDDDINLGGKEWVPIGRDRTCAFTGIFDGDGHTVKNFVIKNKKTENKGFFGFIKGGEVYNLSVDCHISGGTCSGGIAAQCEDGVIGCSAAIIDVKGKNGSFGGLVGRNTGTIFQCYTAGQIVFVVIPWWWCLPLFGISLFFIVLLVLPRVTGFFPTFAPVPYDDDQIPIPNETINPNTDGNFVSFQFEQKIDVDLIRGLCKFAFKNPGNSNHNIVVQLQFTDAQATRVMGSTGRTPDEQKKLSDNPDYDPETYRMIIAESGSIHPGYQLENLRLVRQPNGATLSPGDYNAMVYLVFYDIKTNNRAMMESQLPVVISVK